MGNKKLIAIVTALLIALSLMPAMAQNGAGYDPRADYNGDIDSKALRLMEKAKAQSKLVDLAAIIWRERPDTARR